MAKKNTIGVALDESMREAIDTVRTSEIEPLKRSQWVRRAIKNQLAIEQRRIAMSRSEGEEVTRG